MPRSKAKPRPQLAELYALTDPRDGEVRYIGKAAVARKRLTTHIQEARYRTRPVNNWVSKLVDMGLRPQLRVLMVSWDWETSERELIAQWRQEQPRLLNVADGGATPKVTREQCSKGARAAGGFKKANVAALDPFPLAYRYVMTRLGRNLHWLEKNDSPAELIAKGRRAMEHVRQGYQTDPIGWGAKLLAWASKHGMKPA